MDNEEIKRFPPEFDEIGRDLEDGDILLGADGRTGKPVKINVSRVGGSGGESSKIFSPLTGTEYRIVIINGVEQRVEV